MMPAAKMMDPVLGVDVHIVQPPGPVPPVPIPHPFVGMLIDPMDFVPIVGATIMVNGMPRAIAGTAGKCLPPHIPMGGVFVKPPTNECEMFMGSATVVLDGDPASYMALPALSCQDVGMPAPFRTNPKKKTKTKSLVLPTSVVLPIPAGLPVLIGGPPTISMMALGMKAGMAGLAKLAKSKVGKALKRGFKKLRQKACKNMKPGFLKCKVLRAEPVHVVTGEVVVEQRDFTLPWRVPLDWTRRYGSQQARVGSLGRGWETPADARLEFPGDGSVLFHDGTAGAAVFPSWPVNGPVTELVAGATLDRTDGGLVVRTKGGLRWFFRAPAAGEGEVPLAHVADGCDNWVQYVRDGSGALVEIRDNAGQRVVVKGRAGLLESLDLVDPATGALHPLVRYEYDARGDLCAVYDALGVPYRFAYDWHRRLERHTDRVGLSFRYEYDGPLPDARCVHAFGDGGLYDYRFAYEPAVGRVRVTDSLGHTSVIEWNDDLLPVRETDPLGGVTTWEYDAAGRCSAQVDPIGRRTEWAYDERGGLVQVIRPDGTTVAIARDPSGKPVSVTDPTGAAWQRVWDERGLLRKRVSPRGGEWTYDYSDLGDLVRRTDPLGHSTLFEPDAHGRLVAFTDALGRTTRLEVDTAGRVTASTDATGARTAFGYDAKGRLLQIRRPTEAVRHFAYDAADNVIRLVDESGRRTELRYTGIGELAARVRADGSVIRYTYDTEERLAAITNEHGQRFRLERDALGRVTRTTDYWGHDRTFAYDPAGRPASSHDALGRRTRLAFDALDRLSAKLFDDGTADRFEYDAAGRLVRAANVLGEVRRAYDPDGNLVEEFFDGAAVRSEYDLIGRRIRRTSPAGRAVGSVYDAVGNVELIALDDVPFVRIERGADDLPRRERIGDALTRERQFTPGGRLRRQVLRRGPVVVSDRTYEYDPVGELLVRDDARKGRVELTYDALGRVVGQRDVGLAPAGSVRGAVRVVEPAGGRPAGPTGANRYDAAGNLVARPVDGGAVTLAWDRNDRLVRATDAQGRVTHYGYDALGRRVFKRTGDAEVRFRWDDDVLLSETAGGRERELVTYPDTFEPLALLGDEVRCFENDCIGLPHELVGLDGEVVWSAAYGPHGDVTRRLVEVEPNPLRLQGQYHDDELGLHYNRYRYFDPTAGAFVSQDPLGLGAGDDLYEFAPNVWRWIDPLGLACLTKADYDQRMADACRRHGGTPIPGPPPDSFQFPNRRAAKQAAGEVAGDLGSAPVKAPYSTYRGAPRPLSSSHNTYQVTDATGTRGWRDDRVGHRFDPRPHFNAFDETVDANYHLFY